MSHKVFNGGEDVSNCLRLHQRKARPVDKAEDLVSVLSKFFPRISLKHGLEAERNLKWAPP